MRVIATKQLRSFPEAKEKDPKATRKKKECTKFISELPRQPRAHGPRRPRAHGLHRELALEHPVRTGLYRAHGTPVRTGPTYLMRTGSSGWTAESRLLGLHFVPFLHLPIYISLSLLHLDLAK